jgi:hypothetical protein
MFQRIHNTSFGSMVSSQPKTTIQGLQQPCFTKEHRWMPYSVVDPYNGSWMSINYGPASPSSYLEIVAIGKICYQIGTLVPIKPKYLKY